MLLITKKWRLSRLVFMMAALSLMSLILAGCSSAPNPVYYRVDYQPNLAAAGGQAGKLVLMVDRLDSSQPLTQPNIIHRLSTNSFLFEPYSFWEAAPAEMAQRALVTGFRETEYFNRVTTKRLSPDVDLVFRGRLERFEWVSGGSVEQAQVVLSFEIYNPIADRVVFNGRSESLTRAGGKGLEAVAAAMTKALSQAVNSVVDQVVERAGK